MTHVKTAARRNIQKLSAKYPRGVNLKHSTESTPEAGILGEGICNSRNTDVIIGPALIMYKCNFS